MGEGSSAAGSHHQQEENGICEKGSSQCSGAETTNRLAVIIAAIVNLNLS